MTSQPPPDNGHYPTYQQLTDDLAWHREQPSAADTYLTAIGALVDQHRGIDVPAAIGYINKLLNPPVTDQLFPPVATLRQDLLYLRNLLVGAYGEGKLVRRESDDR